MSSQLRDQITFLVVKLRKLMGKLLHKAFLVLGKLGTFRWFRK